jgi:hypothetical protein
MPSKSVSDGPLTEREIIDNEHLRVLSIAHYVFGALHALLSCVLLVHFVLGLVIATAPLVAGNGHGQGPPTWFGLLLSALSGCFMLVGWLFGALTIYSGVCMKQRKHRTFSLVMAVVNCFSIPFGTALGVFTVVVLTRNTVRALYMARSS